MEKTRRMASDLKEAPTNSPHETSITCVKETPPSNTRVPETPPKLIKRRNGKGKTTVNEPKKNKPFPALSWSLSSPIMELLDQVQVITESPPSTHTRNATPSIGINLEQENKWEDTLAPSPTNPGSSNTVDQDHQYTTTPMDNPLSALPVLNQARTQSPASAPEPMVQPEPSETSESDYTAVKSNKKKQKNPKPDTPQPNSKWVTFLLTAITAFPKGKINELVAALTNSVGIVYIRNIQEQNKGLSFELRDDGLNRADNFSFENKLFKVQRMYKNNNSRNAIGVINIPEGADFKTLRTTLIKQNNNIAEIKQGYEIVHGNRIPSTTATIQFKTQEAPLKVQGQPGLISPALLSPVRCNKCQKFGHATRACNNNLIFCPHCAESHVYNNQCKRNPYRKCSNCGDKHGAFSTSCRAYLDYIRKLNNKNNAVMAEFRNKCQKAGEKIPVDNAPIFQRTNSSNLEELINKLAPQLENKSVQEIKEILTKNLTEEAVKESKTKEKTQGTNENKTTPTIPPQVKPQAQLAKKTIQNKTPPVQTQQKPKQTYNKRPFNPPRGNRSMGPIRGGQRQIMHPRHLNPFYEGGARFMPQPHNHMGYDFQFDRFRCPTFPW